MRLRKKPNLRVEIPSYPEDYVEMPPEVRRLTASLSPSGNTEHGMPSFQDESENAGSSANENPTSDSESSKNQTQGRPLPNYDYKPDNSPKDMSPNRVSFTKDISKVNVPIGRPLPNYELPPTYSDNSPKTSASDQVIHIGRPLPNYGEIPQAVIKAELPVILINSNEIAQNDTTKPDKESTLPYYENILLASPKVVPRTHHDYYPKTNFQDDRNRANFQIGTPNYEDRPETPEVTVGSTEEVKGDKKEVNFGDVVYRKISRCTMSVPYGLQYGDRNKNQNVSKIFMTPRIDQGIY